jgi:NTP pyrophosphatase (non-canonical NTP hydrolase)
MPTMSSYQALHKEWSEKNFPNETWQDVLMGVVEEVGELNHYLLKQKQGIRGTFDEHEAGARDSVGDIMVYLMHVCTLRGWDMERIFQKTIEHVLTREWVVDPLMGVTAMKPNTEIHSDIVQGNP